MLIDEMNQSVWKILPFFLTIFFLPTPKAQNIVDQIDNDSSSFEPHILTEKILRISKNKQIFIITNENDSFLKGDFFSIVLENQLTARALAAKVIGKKVGIKILRIDSLRQWNKIRENLEIQIVRGDDQSFYTRDKKENNEEDLSILKNEDDLFNATKLLEEDLDLEENENRVIKNNNIMSLSLGSMEYNTIKGEIDQYNTPHIAWGYQFEDDLWVEANYGQNIINSFPSEGIDTLLNHFTVKIKYAIEAPFYSIIMPYAGYQKVTTDSPNAGENNELGQLLPEELQKELEDVAKLEKNRMIFGINVLKRLVPGWFIKIDIGSDITSVGLALEF